MSVSMTAQQFNERVKETALLRQERDQLRAELATMPGRLRYLNDSLKKAEAERDQLRAELAMEREAVATWERAYDKIKADKAELLAWLKHSHIIHYDDGEAFRDLIAKHEQKP